MSISSPYLGLSSGQPFVKSSNVTNHKENYMSAVFFKLPLAPKREGGNKDKELIYRQRER
jgi:hypothetical protein